MIQPANKGISIPAARRNIISNIGTVICCPNRIYTIAGSVKGTAIDVSIITPTSVGRLPLSMKLIAKGAPSAVEIPDSNVAESVNFG